MAMAQFCILMATGIYTCDSVLQNSIHTLYQCQYSGLTQNYNYVRSDHEGNWVKGTWDHSTIFAIIATFCKSIIIQNLKIKKEQKIMREDEKKKKKKDRKKKKQLGMNTDNPRDER